MNTPVKDTRTIVCSGLLIAIVLFSAKWPHPIFASVPLDSLGGQQVCSPVPSGSISWWRGEGNANDFFGTNNGVLRNGASFASGVVDQGFQLDGIDDFVEVPDSSSLRPSHLTIEGWVKFNSLDTPGSSEPGLQYIVHKKNTNVGQFEGYTLAKARPVPGSTSDRLAFVLAPAGGFHQTIWSTTEIAVGQFYHVAATYDGARMKLYINGVQEAESSYTFPLDFDTRPLFIGTSGESFFDGKLSGVIDELSIYNRALFGSEVLSIFEAGSAGKCVLPSNQPPHAGFTIKSSELTGGLAAIEGQDLVITSRFGSALVDLNPDRSSDADGSIASWEWIVDGILVSDIRYFTRSLALGEHTVSLRVADDRGASSISPISKITVKVPNSCSVTNTSPAADDTILLHEESDSKPLGGRTPLILVHGIHGNQQPNKTDSIALPNREYFRSLINHLKSSSDFLDRYKIFTFHYVSDRHYVQEIAGSLRDEIDSLTCHDPNFDKEIVVLAHSMGGLVARSYMNEYRHNVRSYVGEFGGARVSKLITMGTPHHGTPGALSVSRDQIATRFPFGWENVLDAASLAYWELRWRNLGFLKPTRLYFEPNRYDLLWDDFDGIVPLTNPDVNNWLRQLNQLEAFEEKIKAYYGYIDQQDPIQVELIRRYNADGANGIFVNVPELIFDLKAADEINDNRRKQEISSIVIHFGLGQRFGRNDGLVPEESGSFQQANISRVECPGYNHEQMRDGKPTLCRNERTLFASVSNDLLSTQ